MKSQYRVVEKRFAEIVDLFVLPKYQRRLVWSSEQKKNFIDNIRQGFPFGSILLYKYKKKDDLSLIDGLQRINALIEYKSEPATYYNDFDQFVERIFNNIKQGHDLKELSTDNINDLKPKIEFILKDCLANHKDDTFFIRNKIIDEVSFYPKDDSDCVDDLIVLQKDLINDALNYLDLDNLVIPCIVYTGDESNLPDVFSNLNSGGTKLSKYQVLAAGWNSLVFEIPQFDEGKLILDSVIKRYKELQNSRDIEIQDFDPDKIRTEREINLSEFCYAIGELIIKNTPCFWNDVLKKNNSQKEDTINVVGHISLAISLGVDLRKITDLKNKFDLLKNSNFIKSLIVNIIKEYEVIQAEFSKWLLFPGIDKDKYENTAITDYQVLSFFAALWHAHFKIDMANAKIETIPNYKSEYEKIRQNLIRYCILDVVNRSWMGSGDSRLASYYIKGEGSAYNSYNLVVSKESMYSRLMQWYEDTLSKGNLLPEKCSKLLLCVFSSFKRNELKHDHYDVEHIISKKKLKKDSVYEKDNIPGGYIGNLMYLGYNTNRSKHEKNLYNYLGEHEAAEVSKKFLELMIYPKREDLDSAELSLGSENSEKAKKILDDRAKTIISELSNMICQ